MTERASLAGMVTYPEVRPSERESAPANQSAAAWRAEALLDHAEAHRDDESLMAMWRDPAARLLRISMTGESPDLHSSYRPSGDLASGDVRSGDLRSGDMSSGDLPSDVVFLGLVEGVPWFARRDAHVGGVSLKSSGLDELSSQLLASAQAVLNWHEAEPHCGRCGGQLRWIKGGFAASCAQCACQQFPRTDPAVIVAVLNDQDELFLAHQSGWPAGRMSLLAGFVEAGESFEAACHREIAEEASLRLAALRYLSSQPWPFPRSVMVGFVARSVGGVIGVAEAGQVDGVELDKGGFFSRGELTSALESGEVTVPSGGSISARIIADWLAHRLPAPESAS